MSDETELAKKLDFQFYWKQKFFLHSSEVKEYLPLCPFGSAERCLITAR